MYFSLEDLLKFPAPNYVNPETRGDGLTILNAIFLAFATIFIVLRLWSRLFVRKWFGLDDVLIVFGFMTTAALNGITFDGFDNHMWGRHLWDIPLDQAQAALKLAYFSKLLYLLCGMFICFGLLAFYYRLVGAHCPLWFRWTLHGTTAFNAIYWTAVIIAEINICTPVSYYWTFPGPPGAKCINEGPLTLTKGVVKVFIDLWITTLPIPWVMQTKMKRRQRYMVAMLFAMGYVVTGAGAARVYYTHKVFFTNNDLSWWLYPTFIASTIENNLAIICACAPTVRPLFPVLFGGPVGRIKGWVSAPRSTKNLESGEDTGDDIRNPARATSQAGIRKPSHDLSTWSSHGDDVELVIQKNEDQNMASRKQGSFLDLTSDEPLSPPPTTRAMAIRTSDLSGFHPFDPRLDHHHSSGGWIGPVDLRSMRSDQTRKEEV